MKFTLKKYTLANGRIPFDDWLDELSPAMRARVHSNLVRIEVGNFGNAKPIQGADAKGLFELRMFFGPGYRAYFGKDGDSLVLLLCGGDKKTQRRDISEAKKLWKEFKTRKAV